MRDVSIVCILLFVCFLSIVMSADSFAQQKPEVSLGADFVSRYNWRGIDFGDAPAMQPSVTLSYYGAKLGFWGSYASTFDEIDTWLSYTFTQSNGIAFTGIVTDYYFPNAGIDFFNFNNYDATKDDTIPDPGAHTVEVGLSVTGPEALPIEVAGFVNIHNDAGNCTYFQLSYPFSIGETSLEVAVGATGGSKDNPHYYGSDDFAVINIGLRADKEIAISEQFSLPVFVSFVLNPKAEQTFMVFGFTI
jgi:hypothetical protein